jgi:hypothetical protein
MHLTLLLLDFEIVETIPLGERRHVRSVFEKSAHKLVSQAISNGQIHASNKYLQMFEGAATRLILRLFICVSDWRTICDGKICWSKFHYLLTLFLLFLTYN